MRLPGARLARRARPTLSERWKRGRAFAASRLSVAIVRKADMPVRQALAGHLDLPVRAWNGRMPIASEAASRPSAQDIRFYASFADAVERWEPENFYCKTDARERDVPSRRAPSAVLQGFSGPPANAARRRAFFGPGRSSFATGPGESMAFGQTRRREDAAAARLASRVDFSKIDHAAQKMTIHGHLASAVRGGTVLATRPLGSRRGPAKRQTMTVHPASTHPFPCRRRTPAGSGGFRFPNRRAYGMTLGIKGSPLSGRRIRDDSFDTALTRLSMKRNDQTSPAWATVSHWKGAPSERALWRVFGMFLSQGAWSCLLHGTFPGRVFPFSYAWFYMQAIQKLHEISVNVL